MRMARIASDRLNVVAAPTVPLPSPFSRISRGIALQKKGEEEDVR